MSHVRNENRPRRRLSPTFFFCHEHISPNLHAAPCSGFSFVRRISSHVIETCPFSKIICQRLFSKFCHVSRWRLTSLGTFGWRILLG